MSHQNKMSWKSPGQIVYKSFKNDNLAMYCALALYVLAIARTSEKNKLDFGTMSHQNKMSKSPGQIVYKYLKNGNLVTYCALGLYVLAIARTSEKNTLDFGTMSHQNKMSWRSPGQIVYKSFKKRQFGDVLCTCIVCPGHTSPGHLKKIS